MAEKPTTKTVKMITVEKNATNAFAKYKYRTIDDILDAVKKSGQTVQISDEVVEVGGRVFVKATATSGDETASGFAELGDHKGMSPEQMTGTASTYARKYALCGLFGIATEDDPDAGDNGVQAGTAQNTGKKTDAEASEAQKNFFKTLCANADDETKKEAMKCFSDIKKPMMSEMVKAIAILKGEK